MTTKTIYVVSFIFNEGVQMLKCKYVNGELKQKPEDDTIIE